MDELIRKQDAIEAINLWLYCDKDERMPADVIKALPPVQPKRGTWIERNPLNSDKCRLIECDQCGNSHIVGFNVPYEHWTYNRNYCEKCGADMRGEAE